MLHKKSITKIKNLVLGSAYDLSVGLITSETSHELNHRYRGKDRPTNVLSFPLSPEAGEILLDEELIAAEAWALAEKPAERRLFLFIHGLLHLKGFRHGSRMESEEQKLIKLFSHNAKNYHRRPRHRHRRHPVGSLRSQ